MIRLARSGDEQTVAERGETERVRAGAELGRIFPAFPSAGTIELSIAAGGRWYLDDAEPRTAMHAYLEDNGKVYVTLVYGPSETRLERLLFLAEDLLATYGNRIGVFPDAGTPETDDAKVATGARLVGKWYEIRLQDGRDALRAAIAAREKQR